MSRVAWWMVGCGMASGAVLGLWSFGGPVPAPGGFVAYDDLPRRLLRLAHIALIALPLLSLELERALTHTRLSAVGHNRVRRAVLFGILALPALLALAALWSPALYLLSLPVSALMGSVFAVASSLTPVPGTTP
jgi:hypothetical protein